MTDDQVMGRDRPRDFDKYLRDSLMAQPMYMMRFFLWSVWVHQAPWHW